MRTLIAGFGPFGSVRDNPSERLANHFRKAGAEGHDITSLALPTAFKRAPNLLTEALCLALEHDEPYDTVFLIGVHCRTEVWRVERCGWNRDHSRIDVDGFRPPRREIVECGPKRLPVTVPIARMVSAIRDCGLPAVASQSAGGFLCNHILYRALHVAAERRLTTRIGFLHIPPDEQTFEGAPPSRIALVGFDQQIRAAEAALSALACG